MHDLRHGLPRAQLGAALRQRAEQHVAEHPQPGHDFVVPRALVAHAGQRQRSDHRVLVAQRDDEEVAHARSAQRIGVRAGGRRQFGDGVNVDDAAGDDLVDDPRQPVGVRLLRRHRCTDRGPVDG